MGTKRMAIGFDRRIELSWLDATADWAAQGLSTREIRAQLEQLLSGRVAGDGPHSARGKTMTVLLHIWALVPERIGPLRADGFALLRERSGRHRLPLHWGMCMATYPFFRDVAATIGRLLALQGSVASSQIQRRVTGQWGKTSTVVRAVQRVARSLLDWGVLSATPERGVYSARVRLPLHQDEATTLWLLESAMLSADSTVTPLPILLNDPVFFPFKLSIALRAFSGHRRLHVHTQGVNDALVELARLPAPARAPEHSWLSLFDSRESGEGPE